MDGGPWWAAVHGIAESEKAKPLPFLLFLLAKAMATHSSVLAWRIPWMERPGGLQSMVCKESDATKQLTQAL